MIRSLRGRLTVLLALLSAATEKGRGDEKEDGLNRGEPAFHKVWVTRVRGVCRGIKLRTRWAVAGQVLHRRAALTMIAPRCRLPQRSL